MDLAAVDAGSVDAGLRKFVPAVVITFIDEDVVIDATGNDVELGVGDVSCGELGVVLGRRLGVAGADGDVGRTASCRSPASSMPKACTMPGAIANTALMRASCTSSAGAASSGSSLRKYSGTIGLLRQPRWKARYFSGLTRAADPERREAALRMAGDADPIRVDRLAPDRIVQQEADAAGDVARALPELVREIGDGGVVGVGAVMVERRHDLAVRG